MHISGAAQDESSGQMTFAGRSEVETVVGESGVEGHNVWYTGCGYLCQATVGLVSIENHHGFWRLVVSTGP